MRKNYIFGNDWDNIWDWYILVKNREVDKVKKIL